jgi:hypothetical protein
VFDAVLTPGDIILLVSWRDNAAAEAFEGAVTLRDGARLRRVRVVRDYGMFDRREAPQYHPDAKGAETNTRDPPRSGMRRRRCGGTAIHSGRATSSLENR